MAILAPNVLLIAEVWSLAPWVGILVLTGLQGLLSFFFLPETKGKNLPDLHEDGLELQIRAQELGCTGNNGKHGKLEEGIGDQSEMKE